MRERALVIDPVMNRCNITFGSDSPLWTGKMFSNLMLAKLDSAAPITSAQAVRQSVSATFSVDVVHSSKSE
jgi:hypothetical protein